MMKHVSNSAELQAALRERAAKPPMRLGEMLLFYRRINPMQLEAVVEAQGRNGKEEQIGRMMVRRGWISEEELATALIAQDGKPLVEVHDFDVPVEVLSALPFALASQHRLLPLAIFDLDGVRTLVVAKTPVEQLTIQLVDLENRIGGNLAIEVCPANCEDLLPEIESRYSSVGLAKGARQAQMGSAAEIANRLETADGASAGQAESSEGDEAEANSSALVQLVNKVIMDAKESGASDIHLESRPDGKPTRLRLRRDGVLGNYLEIPAASTRAFLARLKIMGGLDISERRKPQDGKIKFANFVPGVKLELRLATLPTNGGREDAVLRLLADSAALPLDRLGLSPHNFGVLSQAIERPYGMILCVGPTGSGKTTTLHSAISYINTPERKIWTAEDPVEITQDGLAQVQVNAGIGLTFAAALRSFLRADPDVIMVGEIRDSETASIAVEAALTGHLVLSTLHTNSAPETVTRLLDMGLNPFSFADSLLVVLAQRLVRRICTSCREEHPLSRDELEVLMREYLEPYAPGEHALRRGNLLEDWQVRFGSHGGLKSYRATGCAKCNGTGLRGRAGLHELLSMTKDLNGLIQASKPVEAIRTQALKDGMRTLRQDGIEKVLAGVTTLQEVRSAANA